MKRVHEMHGFAVRRSTRNEARRGGYVAVVVLVLLGVVSALVLNWMKGIVVQRQHERETDCRAQAQWLAQSGLARAAARLAAKPDYTGETWPVSGADLAGAEAGSVEIHVEPVPGHADRRAIRIVADYPADPRRRIRQLKQITIELAAPAKSAPAGK